jgi:hypothetical protein
MGKQSAVAAAVVSLLLLSLASNTAPAQSSTVHAHYSQSQAQHGLRETLTSFFRGGSGEYVDGGFGVDGNLGIAPGIGACDAGYQFPCDGMGCDGIGCDGMGGNHRCRGAFCLFGGHDMPYDLAIDGFGLAPESCFDIGGWTQFGYDNRSTGMFNRHPDRLNNHQTWLFMEKLAVGELGLDWGFRVDAMYGVDADEAQAFGNPAGSWDFQNGYDHGIYGFAMPQLYVEVACEALSVKAGHFLTPLRYESIAAPDNFFYSHSFTGYFSEPFTLSGALATYHYDQDVILYGGWTAGWDTGFNQLNNGSNFLAGAALRLTDSAAFTLLATLGDFGKIGDGYSQSLVLDVDLTDRLCYAIQSDFLRVSNLDVTTFGVNQYLLYDINKWLAVGTRAEWWKARGVSYYGITAGFNIHPTGNLIIRPEVRYQYSPSGNEFSGIQNAQNPAGLPLNEGAILGIDAILTF